MLSKQRFEKIKKEVEKEFPEDFALQQIHLARRILTEEAKENNISLLEYIKQEARKISKMKKKSKS